jgi:hypothetical protein
MTLVNGINTFLCSMCMLHQPVQIDQVEETQKHPSVHLQPGMKYCHLLIQEKLVKVHKLKVWMDACLAIDTVQFKVTQII